MRTNDEPEYGKVVMSEGMKCVCCSVWPAVNSCRNRGTVWRDAQIGEGYNGKGVGLLQPTLEVQGVDLLQRLAGSQPMQEPRDRLERCPDR